MNLPAPNLSVLLFPVIVAAGMLTGRSDSLSADSDYGLFRASEGEWYLEVYLQFSRSSFNFEPEESRFGTHITGVVAVNKDGRILVYDDFFIDDFVTDPGTIHVGQKIPKMVTFQLPPGSYEVVIVVEDQIGQRYQESFTAVAPAYLEGSPAISSLELAHKIRRADDGGEFSKFGLTIVPNASAIYGSDQDRLHYYAEIYGVTPLDSLRLQPRIFLGDSLVVDGGIKVSEVPGSVYLERGSFGLSELATGQYRLELAAFLQSDTFVTEKVFTVVRAEYVSAELSSPLQALPDSIVAGFGEALSLLSPTLDVDFFRTSEPQARRNTIGELIQALAEKSGQEPVNIFNTLLHRWRYTDEQFGSYQVEGWLTDRGRTYFSHGPPTEIEVYPSTGTSREYHIWSYEKLEGGSRFIFIDFYGFGQFALVHSTYSKSIVNETWPAQVLRTTSGTGINPIGN